MKPLKITGNRVHSPAPKLMISKYQGVCADCEEIILPGDTIHWWPAAISQEKKSKVFCMSCGEQNRSTWQLTRESKQSRY